ncbi:MAG: response regulator [Pelosinus sp.]|nr:response regulator [Pelosinus sp.]
MPRKLTYLIVEDDAASVRIVKLELAAQGYQVKYDHVENELDMRQKISVNNYDFIISDHHMPSFTSLEALRIRNEMAPLVPFVIFSIKFPKSLQDEALSAGCSAVISKDCIGLLAEVIEKLV